MPQSLRRDLAAMLGLGLNGASTSALVVLVARMVGIDIFCTGGLGGVHRGASETFDISADLDELGKTRCIVVSAGSKAILDLPKTLEYLETKGVGVFGWRTDILPAFYSSTSPYKVDYRIDTVQQMVDIYRAQEALGIESGMMLCNPIEKEFEVPENTINPIIERAVHEAEAAQSTAKTALRLFLLKSRSFPVENPCRQISSWCKAMCALPLNLPSPSRRNPLWIRLNLSASVIPHWTIL